MKWKASGKRIVLKKSNTIKPIAITPITPIAPVKSSGDAELAELVKHVKESRNSKSNQTILINIDDIRNKATQLIKDMTQELLPPLAIY